MSTASPTQIIATPASETHEAAFAVVAAWCDKFDVAPNQLMNAIVGRMAFCMRNYTTVDAAGNPVVEMNLGKILTKTRTNVRRQKRGKRKRYSNAF